MTGSSNISIKQVKKTVQDVGSVIKGSKKRISWTFFLGKEERTVVLLWSKNSGKRQVTEGGSNDDDYAYEETKKGNFFFHKWDSRGAKLHIIASSHTPAKDKVCDNFIKFELIVNGRPFSKLSHHDGTPLPEKDGPGPYGIFDIVYPQGYDVNFTKEAPFHSKDHLHSVVLRELSSQSMSDVTSNVEESAPFAQEQQQ
ncbi:unnamed protein product [Cylindrotheca closterium]|uniref:Uncharacterized protein n=1 Tax=Cylindrotheca closterium TaxID=2856 RepID=A0AAD2FBH0_9STRA|nr:unnamed protein product [Cylindrotheca closterium]